MPQTRIGKHPRIVLADLLRRQPIHSFSRARRYKPIRQTTFLPGLSLTASRSLVRVICSPETMSPLHNGVFNSGGNATVSLPITLAASQSIINNGGSLLVGAITQNGYQLTFSADAGTTTTVNGQVKGAGGVVVTTGNYSGSVVFAAANACWSWLEISHFASAMSVELEMTLS